MCFACLWFISFAGSLDLQHPRCLCAGKGWSGQTIATENTSFSPQKIATKGGSFPFVHKNLGETVKSYNLARKMSYFLW